MATTPVLESTDCNSLFGFSDSVTFGLDPANKAAVTRAGVENKVLSLLRLQKEEEEEQEEEEEEEKEEEDSR
ncbi:hypothetical protein H920_01711 [Fukomys damarensis]|uniref:Uncharacterized protein n=1 Tax=Fukomys damarensis TaxID=885580 RepID=A0A091DXN7_FUKDA|nr:hypothetical protein H920_01711 [Fukomys damarensis]